MVLVALAVTTAVGTSASGPSFALCALETLLMALLKLAVGMSAVVVDRHLSPAARAPGFSGD